MGPETYDAGGSEGGSNSGKNELGPGGNRLDEMPNDPLGGQGSQSSVVDEFVEYSNQLLEDLVKDSLIAGIPLPQSLVDSALAPKRMTGSTAENNRPSTLLSPGLAASIVLLASSLAAILNAPATVGSLAAYQIFGAGLGFTGGLTSLAVNAIGTDADAAYWNDSGFASIFSVGGFSSFVGALLSGNSTDDALSTADTVANIESFAGSASSILRGQATVFDIFSVGEVLNNQFIPHESPRRNWHSID